MLRKRFYLFSLMILIACIPAVAIAGVVNCKTDKKKGEDHCGSNARAGDQYQCTTYVQHELPWVGHLGVSLNEKKSHKNYQDKSKTKACVNGVAVISEGAPYGHVGIVVADLGSQIRIRDRNYCCDGVDRVHEISISKVEGYICQSSGTPAPSTHVTTPAPSAHGAAPTTSNKKYFIRISNVDDEGTSFVNGHKAASVGFYQDTGWVDVTSKLHKGDNKIEFKVKNKKGGYSYHFQFKENDNVQWDKSCGEVGKKGCSEHLPKGNVLTKKFTFRM